MAAPISCSPTRPGYIVTSAPLPGGADSLHLAGLGLGVAIFAGFLYRIFTFWLPLIPPGIALPRVRSLNEALPDVEREQNPPCRLEAG